jgi:hypothetical protein
MYIVYILGVKRFFDILFAMKDANFINMRFSDVTLQAIEDFRFANRFPSRTAAIRFLVEWALKQQPQKDEKAA